jgi:hypothetical protein
MLCSHAGRARRALDDLSKLATVPADGSSAALYNDREFGTSRRSARTDDTIKVRAVMVTCWGM